MIQLICPYCEGKDFINIDLNNCKDLYCGSPYLVTYLECRNCHSWLQKEIPEDISILYNAYPSHSDKTSFFQLLRNLIGFQGYLNFPNDSIPIKEVDLLDYGCGDGGYLNWVKNVASKTGYDPLSQKIHLNNNPSQTYHVVTLNHVLEHTSSPYEAVRKS